ncbi:hypothetical protein EON65_47415, partial [archaeon]
MRHDSLPTFVIATYPDDETNRNLLQMEVPLALGICIMYIFVAMAIHSYKRQHGFAPWIHESSVSCLFGLLAGGLIQFVTGQAIVFSNTFFFYLVLPPIIFSAGFGLKKKKFFQHIHLILFYGLFGTIVNFLLIALGSYYYQIMFSSISMTWNEAFLLSSVLCGSDEVSAMSIIPIRDFPRLGALIFGEGVINDALSIVLFETYLPLTEESSVDSAVSVYSIVYSICLQLVGSVFIGSACGLILSYILKHIQIRFAIYQSSLIILFGYLSYSVAECVEMSGILTLFVCAIILSHYAYYSLSKSAQIATKISFAAISDIAEGFAFAYVGLSLWSYTYDMDIQFSIYMLLVVCMSRLVSICILTYVYAYYVQAEQAISFKEQLAFVLGGTVRGCLCWAQILQIHSTPLISATLLIVLVTTLLGGFLMPILLPSLLYYSLNIAQHKEGDLLLTPTAANSHPNKEQHSPSYIANTSLLSTTHTTSSKADILSMFFVRWVSFDEGYMKRWFGGSRTDSRRRSLLHCVEREIETKDEQRAGVMGKASAEYVGRGGVEEADESSVLLAIKTYFDGSDMHSPVPPPLSSVKKTPLRALDEEEDVIVGKDEDEMYYAKLDEMWEQLEERENYNIAQRRGRGGKYG